MKAFMGKDFLLNNEVASTLYFNAAAPMPIFDWHCHLSAKEIYENKTPKDITELWLGGDHYKWRAERSMGIDEKYITGDADSFEKFKAFAKTLSYAIGNPLYHWAHLELQRYFNIYTPLSEATAKEIFDEANMAIITGGFTPRELITSSNVVCLCTTDDPADTLEYHQKLDADDTFKCKVLPAFRPDKALYIEQEAFTPWLESLETVYGKAINNFEDFIEALISRIEFFDSLGCKASDCSLSYVPYVEADEDEIKAIFLKGKEKQALTKEELDKYRTYMIKFFAEKYAEKGWVMELHIGAMRNNNTLMFNKLGPDAGFDSIDDCNIAVGLSRFLDSVAVKGKLPKTVLFNLNPKDNYVLGTMLGNFQSSECASKIQFGSAWWFNDNLDGMMTQMKTLANLGVLGKFIGMVTDSRSFLSYPRHEYFRRIVCALIGDMVVNGLYPCDVEMLSEIVSGISYKNAKEYFGLEL